MKKIELHIYLNLLKNPAIFPSSLFNVIPVICKLLVFVFPIDDLTIPSAASTGSCSHINGTRINLVISPNSFNQYIYIYLDLGSIVLEQELVVVFVRIQS